jgi:hypothetical protein
MMPIFLAVADDTDEELSEAPSRSVEALDMVMLGVEVEELEPYTYEVIFAPEDVGSAHCTETEETNAWNWLLAAV